MDQQFSRRMSEVATKFGELMACPPLTRLTLPRDASGAGVYLLSEGGIHLYVGRGKNIRKRVQQHSRASVDDAPFAFRRAREALGVFATYKRAGSRTELQNDPVFAGEYIAQQRWIATLTVRYVLEQNGVNQALLEVYASDVLGTPYNDFNTT